MTSIGVFQDVFRGGDHAAEAKVSDGEVYGHGQFTGTLDPGAGGDMPSENDVRNGVQYDNATKTGNVHVPALEIQVVDGVAFDTDKIGSQVLVTTGDNVRSGVMFGPDGLTAGTIDLPSAPTVLDGTGYGANSTELTGTRTDCPDVSALASVTPYGDPGSPIAGRWHEENLAEANVRIAITYGVDLDQTGTLDPQGTITPSPPGWSTLYGVAYDELGKPEEGVAIKAKMIAAGEDTESVFDSAIRETVTAADGTWQFANCPQGSTYQVIRGAVTETVVIAVDTTTPVDDFVGSDKATMAAGGLW